MSVIEWFVALAITAIAVFAGFMFCNKYVFGNKQIVDFNQKFNVAYVMSDGGKFERIRISAWEDWENSDAVQVITTDGKPIYTHLANVKLARED